MWIRIEINLFSFIPLISINRKIFREKSTILYFLIQGISSRIFLLRFSINLENLKTISYLLLIISIFIKLGIFPFHFWIISVIEGMEWNISLILITIQKVIPLIIITFILQQNIIIIFCLINSFIAAIRGITMFSTRKIIGFSSVNHLSIIIIAIILSKKILKIYFLIYFYITFLATKTIKFLNINFIFQRITIKRNNKINNISIIIIFLRIAGIPPFLGFLPKILTLIVILKREIFLSSLIILILNTISTYFYLRLSLNNILLNFNNLKTKRTFFSTKFPFQLFLSPIFIIFIWNFKLIKTINFQN